MKKNILCSFIAMFLATYFMSQQAFALGDLREGEYIRDYWIFNQGETETNAGVTVDSQGNIYVASSMTTTELELEPVVSNNHIIKYDQNGTIQWIRTFPYDGIDLARINAITIDSNDNIIATGSVFRGIWQDCLTVKYNSSGEHIWSRYYSDPNYWANDKGYDLAVDSSGAVYVVGKSYLEDNYWNYTGFLIKWSADGFFQGSVVNPKNPSQPPGNENRNIAIDCNDNVYVMNYTQYAQSYTIRKYNSDLVSLSYPSDVADTFKLTRPADITTDNTGNLILAGWTSRVDIMDGVEKKYHDFIKLNDSGEFQCGRQDLFTNPSGLHDDYDGYNAVTTDAAGNIYLAGTDQTTFLTIKFDSNCIAQWGDYASGTPDYLLWRDENRGLGAHANAIVVDADEHIYVSGDSYTGYDENYVPKWDVATVQYKPECASEGWYFVLFGF